MSILQEIYKFVNQERAKFINYDGNIFSRAFSQVTRYRNFLSIIEFRYKKYSKEFIKINTKSQKSALNAGIPVWKRPNQYVES